MNSLIFFPLVNILMISVKNAPVPIDVYHVYSVSSYVTSRIAF